MNSVILSLLIAIRAVESTGGSDPRACGNDLQITPVCIMDVNRIYGTSYTMEDVTDRRRSEEIAVLYLSYWGPRKSSNPDEETFARIWHRGPSKWRDEKGDAYWRKVRRHINKTNRKDKTKWTNQKERRTGPPHALGASAGTTRSSARGTR